MRIAVCSTRPYDRTFLEQALAGRDGLDLVFFEAGLNANTAKLAEGFTAVCLFVNDNADAEVIDKLAALNVKVIALRSAGFNNVDLHRAFEVGIQICRVPAYSPHAVAEHALALILTLNRNIHRAYNRVRDGNFILDGLLGFDLNGKTVGVVGTGRIGAVFARIMTGLGCKVLACDPHPNAQMAEKIGFDYVDTDTLLSQSDIVSLHCPLTPDTRHLIDARTLAAMKDGVMIINTSRGALIDTPALIAALKTGRIGHVGLDVYEEEGDLFFKDLSGEIIADDVFSRLLSFPNVIVTGHQAFFTKTALERIASTTLDNLSSFAQTGQCGNQVTEADIA
ncbi:MAG: 2-hydroxyacid dehydrogenase [Pseudomonadota bacterium]|nr:2-hydroxyacid dehydrogenase [Pseudomonadota bacterium]